MVDERRRRGLDQRHEVGVRGLEVLDDAAQLLALGVGERDDDDDVEGVPGKAARGAEDPVDAELGLAEHEGLAGVGGHCLDLDAEEEADGVDDAAGGPLLPVHLDEDRGEAALFAGVRISGTVRAERTSPAESPANGLVNGAECGAK
ncbi:MAG: hypothetical protein R3B99_14660 [Polyangiales bacterium]